MDYSLSWFRVRIFRANFKVLNLRRISNLSTNLYRGTLKGGMTMG